MKQWLNSLPPVVVTRIANDLGYEGSITHEAISHIIEQAKTYRWTKNDLYHRYFQQGGKSETV